MSLGRFPLLMRHFHCNRIGTPFEHMLSVIIVYRKLFVIVTRRLNGVRVTKIESTRLFDCALQYAAKIFFYIHAAKT